MVSRIYNNVSKLKRDPCNTRTNRTRWVAVGKRKWLLFVNLVKETWGQKGHYTLINYSWYKYLNSEERWFTHFSHSTRRSVSRNAMRLTLCVFQRIVSIKFILLTWAMQKSLYFTFLFQGSTIIEVSGDLSAYTQYILFADETSTAKTYIIREDQG